MELLGYTLENIYLAGLIIGGSLTLLYILLGDIIEGMFEFIPEGIFNPSLVLSFISIFSGAGYLFERLSAMNSFVIFFFSGGIAFLVVTLLNIFVFIPLSNAEESLAYSDEDLKGRIGKVIVTIPADGFGEVIIESKTLRIAKSARSFDGVDIPYDSEVLVIDVNQGVLHVTKHEKL
ncbi:NfeD family protein [Bacillus alkalicellulosilyticus]|uniref:NfeD family protein n=1 Tax=Alkalihalobacterium alkalicellulosilyticum TaxID=1912214 RepID=UPI0009965660|nr:NfeD family protein [Bacillus alkalicellulosilyticus]